MARALASTSAETLATGAALAALAFFQLSWRRSLFSLAALDSQPCFNLQSCVWFGDEEYAGEGLVSAKLRHAFDVIAGDGTEVGRAGGGGGRVALSPGGC